MTNAFMSKTVKSYCMSSRESVLSSRTNHFSRVLYISFFCVIVVFRQPCNEPNSENTLDQSLWYQFGVHVPKRKTEVSDVLFSSYSDK